MTSTEPESSPRTRGDRTKWLPLGLWLGGLLALVRSSTIFALAHREVGLATTEDATRFLGEVIAAYPDVLTQSLVVGLAIGALSLRTAEVVEEKRSDGLAKIPFLFSTALVLSLLSGWPLGERGQMSQLFGEFAVDDVAVLACFSAIVVGLAFVVGSWLIEVREPYDRRGMRGLFVGRPALLAALLIPVLMPASVALALSSRTLGLEQVDASTRPALDAERTS